MPVLSNTRHEKFAQELAKGKSATEAYKLAGYNSKGQGAEANSSRLIRNDKVRARLAELQERGAERAEITVERVLRELGKIGFSNMLDYMRQGADGDPYLDFSALSRDQAAALQEVTVEDFKEGRGADARDVRRIKFKLADKRAALVDLGKHLGMFVERTENVNLNHDVSDEPLTEDEWAAQHETAH